jgi:DNA primase
VIAVYLSRVVAEDLVDYWDEVDVGSDDSEYAQDNADTIGGARDAWIVLQRALHEQKAKQLLIELETAGAIELFDEAENRLGIARDQVKALHPKVEAKQRRAASALAMGYARLVVQRHRLGI